MTLQQPEERRVLSWGSCPWITGPWQWRAAQAPGRGGVDSDLWLHTGFLVAAAAALAFHAHLWGLRWYLWLAPVSGTHLGGALNPLSLCTRKRWSLASSAAPDFFPDSLPASCGALAPFRLCSCSQPQSSPWDPTEARASAPSPRPPWEVSRQASRASECCSAPSLCDGISPLCPPHPCCCTLLHGSKASPLRHPQSPPVKGLPRVWKPFLLHSSLPLVKVLSLFFCLCFFYFLLPYPGTWGVSCLLGSLRSSASVQYVLCRSCSTRRFVSDLFVGRKVICVSYSSAILKHTKLLLFVFLDYFCNIVLFSFLANTDT